jgi:hypothetical protein
MVASHFVMALHYAWNSSAADSRRNTPNIALSRRVYRPSSHLYTLMAALAGQTVSITRGHLRETLRSWSAPAVTTS